MARTPVRCFVFHKKILIGEIFWTDVEPGEYSISDYAVSNQFIHLLRHAKLPREDDGAIEFWRIKDDLQKYFLHCHHWSDDKWKKNMAGGGGGKDTSIVLIRQEQSCTSELFKVHSGRSLIDPTLQDNVVIPSNFFQYIYHVGCAINSHSIINSGLIDINLALKKGLKFYQTRSNANILHETLPAYCIPKVVRMETGEVKNEKVKASPRPTPKISLKHDWMKELGSEVAQRPDGQNLQQFEGSQLNQIQTQIMIERGNPLSAVTQITSQEFPKHVPLMKAKFSTLETKQIMIERGNPLSAVTQFTSQVTSNQC